MKRWFDRRHRLSIVLMAVLMVLAAASCLLFRSEFQAITGLWYRKRMLAYLAPMLAAFILNLFRPSVAEKHRSLVRCLFAALAIVLSADVFQRMAWYEPKVLSVSMEPRFIAVNISIAAVIYMAVWLLVWDSRTAAVVLFWLMYLLGYAYTCVLELRGTVFQLSDLAIAHTALSVMEHYRFPIHARHVFWAMVGAALMAVAAWVPPQKSRTRKARAGKAVCAAAAAAWLLVLLGTPLLYRMGTVTTTFQADAIYFNARQGALSTLMKEAWELRRNKPEGYSAKAVSQIDSRLLQEGIVQEGKQPHVVVVMVESLTDYQSLYRLPVNEDALPFLHSLRENTVCGNLYSSAYGGQTSNMEFGFLTGAIPIPGRMTYVIKDTNESTPSLAWQLHAQGYGTYAIHPENKTNYQRNMFYPLLGLDTFYHRDAFAGAQRVHGYVSDLACYEKIVSVLKENRGGQPCFIFTVTMQNHGGYAQGGVEERIRLTDGSSDPELVEYLNCIRHSDEALQWLCRSLEACGEPVLLLVFGDHQPMLDMDAYGKLESLSDAEETFTKYITPFFLWANYPIEPEHIEAVSVNYLASLLMEKGGLSMTGYDQWLLDTAQTYPAVFLHGYVDAALAAHLWEEDESLWPQELRQLNLLRYNRLLDQENRLPALKRLEAAE